MIRTGFRASEGDRLLSSRVPWLSTRSISRVGQTSISHLRDIAGVLKTSGDEIDRGYIDRWAGTLGLVDVWRAVLERLREA